MSTKSIFELENYTAPITHFIGIITEYDISKANINILMSQGLISPETYRYLFYAPKREREITVGKMQAKDSRLSQKLIEGFGIARKQFYEANDIKEYEILSVKKDAIFIMNRKVRNTKFGYINFADKNTYTSYYNLLGIEAYYSKTSNTESIDIKGIGKDNLKLHENYFLDLLQYIFAFAQTQSLPETLNTIKDVSMMYANKEFTIGYYREFNATSMYRTQYQINSKILYLKALSENSNTDYIDPIYNYKVLQELFKMYSGDYFAFHK